MRRAGSLLGPCTERRADALWGVVPGAAPNGTLTRYAVSVRCSLLLVSSPAMRMTLSSSTVPPQLSLKKQQLSLKKAEEVVEGKDLLNERHVTTEGTTRQRPYMGVAEGEIEGTHILKHLRHI